MAYTDAAATAADSTFQSRVRAALHKKCIMVGLGDWPDATQKAHYMGMMTQIISQPEVYTTAFAWALTAHCGLSTSCADVDLDTQIDAIWPAVTGYIAASS
jgi:hypothetical protein